MKSIDKLLQLLQPKVRVSIKRGENVREFESRNSLKSTANKLAKSFAVPSHVWADLGRTGSLTYAFSETDVLTITISPISPKDEPAAL